MRPLLYTDHLSPEDRITVKWWYGRIIVVYSAMILLVFAAVLVRNELIDSSTTATRCGDARSPASRFVGASPAIAAEPRLGAPTGSPEANNALANHENQVKAHDCLRSGPSN
jgi:hypothetical protein